MHNLCQSKLTVVLPNMKPLILLALCFIATQPLARAAELSTFNEVRTQYQSYRDPTRLSYLFNRCAALQLNVSALLLRKGQKQGAKDFENLAQHYMVLSEANERETDKKRGLKSKDTMKTVQRNVGNLSEVYGKRLKDNFAKRGEYVVGDAQLEAELSECNLPDVFKKKAISD
jgi:hypothetical protein